MRSLAIAWGIGLLAATGLLGHRLLRGDERVFLPGLTTHGHHQIELACESCHTQRFTSRDDLQAACVECHGAELAEADDSHPRSKFTDPRNADRVKVLDARSCITCHREHVPEQTLAMGLTLPGDYCHGCHVDVGKERPSHAGLPFDGCTAGGCHNFHDNRALYEDFLVEHAGEPWLREPARVAERNPSLRFAAHAAAPLGPDAHDAPASLPERERFVREWQETSHARSGVNCFGCHGAKPEAGGVASFEPKPGVAACRACHDREAEGFLAGRHGMRLAAGLDPMRPELARLPMRADAHGELGCASCHAAHAFAPGRAAAEACQGCHDDAHTRAWEGSPHQALYAAERAGTAPAGSGVSCATCHLPRLADASGIRVQHDQNANLRPREKMLRSVCLDCHGLAFSIDALADEGLVRTNFRGRPAAHVESISMALGRRREGEARAPER